MTELVVWSSVEHTLRVYTFITHACPYRIGSSGLFTVCAGQLQFEMAGQHVPMCPTGFADFLLDQGWSWSDAMLRQAVEWLAEHGIKDALALEEARLSDMEGVEQWPEEATLSTCVVALRMRVCAFRLQVKIFLVELMQTHRRKRKCLPSCTIEGDGEAR